MIEGVFIGNVPWIEIVVGWGKSVQRPLAILDTGFSGDLQVTPKIAKQLQLVSSGTVDVRIANGQVVTVPISKAISWVEGMQNYIDVIVSDSAPLVGIGFLAKFSYKAIVDCKNRKISLNRAA